MKIKVEKTDKTQRVPREITSKLKEIGILGKLKFMKKELVECPKMKRKISPLYCFQCQYFIRRVKGYIHCKFDEEQKQ